MLKTSTKPQLQGLAIFGNAPAFAEKVHVGRPNTGNRERLLARINDMLDRSWFTNNGPYVQEFEAKVAEFAGVRQCVAMCNATVALEIAIRALGLTGEVIVPSFTFVATAHALQWQEITPVFCDIDPRTHTIDAAQVEKMITPRTTGIIGVHTWGRACDIDALEAIARRHRLQLLFDAAHAFGCTHKGKPIGGFGRCEVFSFHATKFFNTFEGGAVLTNDDDLGRKDAPDAQLRVPRVRQRHLHRDERQNDGSVRRDGTHLARKRRRIHARRTGAITRPTGRGLDGIPGINLMPYDESERANYQYIVVEVDEREAGLTRDALVEVLFAENVLARRYFFPGCHRMEPYRSYFPHAALVLPETDKLCERVMVLPNGTSVDEQAIGKICGVVRRAVANAEAVMARLSVAPAEHGRSSGQPA